MDPLFHRNTKFWIDSIIKLDNESGLARVIPNIKSEYFPPRHTKLIEFQPIQLEAEYYRARMRSDRSLIDHGNDFTGDIVPGGYYDLAPLERTFTKSRSGAYDLRDVNLEAAKTPSPFEDSIRMDLSNPSILDTPQVQMGSCCRLYCFNVGQGDSSLLIVNGNAYLVDTNIYSDDNRARFTDELTSVLDEEGLSRQVKALVITHKHLDHLRGAHRLLDEQILSFDYLIMNHQYSHPTGAVKKFLDACNRRIPKPGWIDGSLPFNVREGEYKLSYTNPTNTTNSRAVAPDINDSSIVFSVSNADDMLSNHIVMTGDASYPILEVALPDTSQQGSTVLKVSHHGSRTGTSVNLVNLMQISHASISAGNPQSCIHPHQETLDVLSQTTPPCHLNITKISRRTAVYDLSGPTVVYL